MTSKITKKSIIFVVGCILTGVILTLLTLYMNYETKEQEEKWNSVLLSVGISLIGFGLFALRRLEIFKDFIESLELLLLLILPVIALMPALVQNPINLAFFFPVYFGASISWFLIIKKFFIDHMDKSNEKRYTESNLKIIWSLLMLFGAMALGIFIFITLPVFVNPNN